MRIRKICTAFCLVAPVLAMVFLLPGCGPGDHAPTADCTNFGVENVRRNLRLEVSIDVTRMPLNGVSDQTVRLIKLSDGTHVPGDINYNNARIVFTPSAQLLDSTEYRFEITDGITDASGQAMNSMSQTFWTGKLLQPYYIDLMRSYDSQANEVFSVAMCFSEGVDSNTLAWGAMNITIYDSLGTSQSFDVTYYDDVATAVLLFSVPLDTGMVYTMQLGANIMTADNLHHLDGDRDGSEYDLDPFIVKFRYSVDAAFGMEVADTVCTALPYYEPTTRCFLQEFY